MDKLSVTVITRNEERNLERCLNALQGVADEIVVVDSFSTDRTLDIARRYGCTITQREFRGFGAQRQYAVGLTSHNFVLSIDADEVIDEELRAALIRLKAFGFTHRVYTIEVVNYLCGSPVMHSGFEPQRHVRLFNKRFAGWNLREVGDAISYADGVQPDALPGTIHHYRCATREEFIRKENRLASLRARELAARYGSISVFSPVMRGLWSYLMCHLGDLAWLDGARGNFIAWRRFKTTREAWHMARHLIMDGADR